MMPIRATYELPMCGILSPVLEATIDQPAVTLWFMPHHDFSIIWMRKKPSGSPSHCKLIFGSNQHIKRRCLFPINANLWNLFL